MSVVAADEIKAALPNQFGRGLPQEIYGRSGKWAKQAAQLSA